MPIVLDEYSVAALPMLQLSNGSVIGQATGFFYLHEGRYFLISNWHVLSGRRTDTGRAIHGSAAVPESLQVLMHVENRLGHTWSVKFPLNDAAGEPIWIQHPDGQDVDVAALPIAAIPPGCVAYELPRPRDQLDMAIRVGADAFILGFPKGVGQQQVLPIWKRASLATEPDLPHENRAIYLVDTATREGMSGAPAIVRSTGMYQTSGGGSVITPGPITRFIGVYSGRYLADNELGAQIGRVWARTYIHEVVAGGVRGSYELR